MNVYGRRSHDYPGAWLRGERITYGARGPLWRRWWWVPAQIGALASILIMLSIPEFTRTSDGGISTEARVMLRQIYELEQRYCRQYGTYIDFAEPVENARRLGWMAPSRIYRYTCENVTDSTFTAIASASIGGDRVEDVWMITEEGEGPVRRTP